VHQRATIRVVAGRKKERDDKEGETCDPADSLTARLAGNPCEEGHVALPFNARSSTRGWIVNDNG
jgi:hypothetical protein